MADEIELCFHGAAQTVTGSCMEVKHGNSRILIDCGLFQGSRGLERLNHGPFRFEPGRIDAVILTHAHIDHSGLLPRLAAQGFSGPIWCTEPTRDLLFYMLADAARLQEGDAERRNRRADRADEPPVEPLYTVADADLALGLTRPADLNQWFEPVPGLRARLWNAGHILGAASVELSTGGMSVLFAGDLGPNAKSLERPAEGPAGVDHVICESTYGDRERQDVDSQQRLALLGAEIGAALERGGNLIIPAFAVERTQELLLDIATLFDRGMLATRPVFIDSPLASRATSVFAKHGPPNTDNGAVFRNSAFHYVESSGESMSLNQMSGAVILAGSGMCEGGRVRHHLVHNLPRRDSTVLFVGYQAQGSLGRTIVDGAKRVRISGRDIAVRAAVRRIESYSAHADRSDLVRWVEARRPIRGSLFFSHGEAAALASLKAEFEATERTIVPAIGERYRLRAGEPAARLCTGIDDIQQVISGDWQNDYADFAVNLKRDLQRISNETARRDAIRRMRRIIDDRAAHRDRHETPRREARAGRQHHGRR